MPDSPDTLDIVRGELVILNFRLGSFHLINKFIYLGGGGVFADSQCKYCFFQDRGCLCSLPVHIGLAQHRGDTGKFSRPAHMVTRCQRRECH